MIELVLIRHGQSVADIEDRQEGRAEDKFLSFFIKESF